MSRKIMNHCLTGLYFQSPLKTFWNKTDFSLKVTANFIQQFLIDLNLYIPQNFHYHNAKHNILFSSFICLSSRKSKWKY